MRNVTGRLAAVMVGAALVAPGAAGAAEPVPASTQAEIEAAAAEVLAGGAEPQELKRATPAWFTDAVRERLRADADGVMAAPLDAPLPGEVGIRPGSWMIAPFFCTMNFLFQKGGTLAIGTAGHCLERDEEIVLLTLAPGTSTPLLVELGRVRLSQDDGVGRDYGLVEVPAELHDWAFPTISVVGGPCGVYSGGDPRPVFYYGHGLVGGTGGTPRAGMGFELPTREVAGARDLEWDEDSFIWAGYLYGGDSGSAVRQSSAGSPLGAVGILTHGNGMTEHEPSVIGWGTRVTQVTRAGWSLVNSPVCL